MTDKQTTEHLLFYTLFCKENYSPLIRPVRNSNETLSVHVSLALSQIISVDEVNQVMKTNVWLQIYWVDYQLTYDNILRQYRIYQSR